MKKHSSFFSKASRTMIFFVTLIPRVDTMSKFTCVICKLDSFYFSGKHGYNYEVAKLIKSE